MTIDDIRRLNHIRYTSFIQLVNNPHSLLVCYILFFARAVKSFIFHRHLKSPSSPVLFYAPTVNNMRALQTVIDNLETENIVWGDNNKNLPLSRVYLKSMKRMGLFRKFYSSSSTKEKALIRMYYRSFMTTAGWYEVINEILDANPQIKTIVLANDHSIENRCLIELAEIKGIKTVYVQHASITEKFPPLHFTYSFLDGMDSFNKYAAIGDIQGHVIVCGSPRFDVVAQYRNINKIYDVGIALNEMDNIEEVHSLCVYIHDNYSLKLAVRPHPRMRINRGDFENKGIAFSDSKSESSFSFLSKIKILIANESSIHLDAALIGTPSVLFNFSGRDTVDWYSYLKNGLMPICHTHEELLSEIRNPHKISEEAVRYYIASYMTKWDGKIGLLVSSLIDCICKERDEEWVVENSEFMSKEV